MQDILTVGSKITDGDCGQHPLHRVCSAAGLPPPIQHLGQTRVLLAGQRPVCRLHGIPHDHLVQHGRVHTPVPGQRTRLVSQTNLETGLLG